MSVSDKPRLAGRQPSTRGGVPRVMTWLSVVDRQQARVGQSGPIQLNAEGAQLCGIPADV